MTAIIIPARNEAAVIGKTLKSVLDQATPADEVIVVCNGCSDGTVAAARRFGNRVTVIETDVASKTNALNLGDHHARSFPRIYLDADVRLEPCALAGIVEALGAGQLMAVSPEPAMDFGNASWAVRAYYEIWLSLPYCRSGMIGAGAYALSRTGRARFGDFPDVIADDGYVRALFTENERGRASGARAVVRAPATLAWLVRIKIRSRLGGIELAKRYPELLANETKDYSSAIGAALVHPLNWPKVLVYLYVNMVSRFLARHRWKDLAGYRWEQDLSSSGSGQ